MTGAGFEELIFLSGVNQLNVSVPLLTKLSSGSEVRIGRALTQSVVWDNHDCDIRCYWKRMNSKYLLWRVKGMLRLWF